MCPFSTSFPRGAVWSLVCGLDVNISPKTNVLFWTLYKTDQAEGLWPAVFGELSKVGVENGRRFLFRNYAKRCPFRGQPQHTPGYPYRTYVWSPASNRVRRRRVLNWSPFLPPDPLRTKGAVNTFHSKPMWNRKRAGKKLQYLRTSHLVLIIFPLHLFRPPWVGAFSVFNIFFQLVERGSVRDLRYSEFHRGRDIWGNGVWEPSTWVDVALPMAR